MALDTSAKNLWLEVQSAERARDVMVERAEEIINSMAGNDWVAGRVEGSSSPDNYIFEFIALMIGRLVADNPAVACTASQQQHQSLADAIQEAVNDWFKNVDHVATEFKDQLVNIVVDQLILWGASLITFEEDKESPVTPQGTRRMRPVSTHIPYWRFFKDPRCSSSVKARFYGHRWVRDKDDLLKDPAYDHEKVEKIVDTTGTEGDERVRSNDSPARNEVTGYEVWVPDADPTEAIELFIKAQDMTKQEAKAFRDDAADKVHGVIYTIATSNISSSKDKAEDKSGYLRDPIAYQGPPWGPYVEWGGFPLPGSPYTISSLQATKEQGEGVNAQQLAISESMMERKTVILTNASNVALKNRLKNAQNGHVYGIPGYTKGAFDQVEIGGPTAQMIQSSQISTEIRDRALGMSEAMRGDPSGAITATADNIANQANGVRVETMLGFVKKGIIQTVRTIAWHMFYSEFFVHELSEEFGKANNMQRPVFSGGQNDANPNNLRFQDLSLDIQPYSVERVDPVMMQGRVQQVIGFVLQTIPMRLQFPFVNWKLLDDQMARAHNFKWLDEIVDPAQLQQFMQHQQQAAAAQQAAQQGPPKPPNISINYKDLPEDDKRAVEQKAGLPASQQPMTAPHHIDNQMGIVQQRQQAQQAQVPLAQRMMGKRGRAA